MSKEDNGGEGKLGNTTSRDSNAEIYENRGPRKIIRVVTVMAYLFSVSFVGILLSAYYIFLWESPSPRLMQRERLRADPQMQFLIAPAPSEATDPTKRDSSFTPQSEVGRVHKPLPGRVTHDGDDSVVDPRDKVNLEKRRRLNMTLLKLRHSLVDTLCARNFSREAGLSSVLNNSFVGVEKELNSTMNRAESTISRLHDESRENVSEEKTRSDNADLPPAEFADSVSVLDVESTSSTSEFATIPGNETSQVHFGDSVTSVTPIIEEKKLDAVESYLVRRLSDARAKSNVTRNSDPPDFGDNNSFKTIQEFLAIGGKESVKQNETDGRRLVDNDRQNDPCDVQMSATLQERVNDSRNHRDNCSNGNESFSGDQVGHRRDPILIDSSSRNLGFIDDQDGFHQAHPDDMTIKSRPRVTGPRNFEGEKMRADLSAFLTTLG